MCEKELDRVGRTGKRLKEESDVFIIAFTLITMFLLVSIIPLALADEPFSQDVKIYDDHWVSSQINPSIAVDENGTAYIVWVDSDNNDVIFSKSTDGGASFASPIVLNKEYVQDDFPSITVDSNIVYVVWHGTGGLYLAKSSDSGTTFTPPEVIWVGSSLTPSVAVDGNNVYVAFIVKTSVVWADSVTLIKSTDGGETFFEPSGKLENYVSGFDLHPSIEVKAENVYVVWDTGGNSGRHVMLGSSNNGGDSFETTNISIVDSENVMANDVDRSIAVDENGNIYVVWNTLGDNENIYINKSIDGGQSFLPGIKINDNNTTGAKASMAVDGDGNVHVTWHGIKNASEGIYYDISSNGGESFGSDIKVNESSAPITYRSKPSIGVDKDCETYIVWQAQRWDYGDGQWADDVYFSTTNGPIFPVTLNSPTEITSHSMKLVWSQNNNSDFYRYELHRSTNENFLLNQSTLVASISNQITTTYNVIELSEGVTYYYKVRLYDTSGLYTDSNEVSGKTTDEIPVAVLLNDPTDVTNSSMILTWNQNTNSDFAKYEIHISTDANFTINPSTLLANITNQTTTFYKVINLLEDEKYYFKVRVYDIGGLFSDSNEVQGKTLENDDIISSDKGLFSVFVDNPWMMLILIIVGITVITAFVKRKSIMRFYQGKKGARFDERSIKKN